MKETTLLSHFSTATMETRNQKWNIFKFLRENNLQPKIVLKNEAKIKTLQTKIESL